MCAFMFKFNLASVPREVHVYSWLFIMLSVLIIHNIEVYYDGADIWSQLGFIPSDELSAPIYAETVYPARFMRTSSDSWSNMFYVVVGVYIFQLGLYDSRRLVQEKDKSLLPVTSGLLEIRDGSSNGSGGGGGGGGYLIITPIYSLTYGASLVLLGFGSMFFHASLTKIGQQIDVTAMYAPLLLLAALAVSRWYPYVSKARIPASYIWIHLAVGVETILFIFKWYLDSSFLLTAKILAVFGIGLVAWLVDRPRRLPILWWFLSLVSVLVGKHCRTLDVKGQWGGKDDIVQGHAVWHLLTAISLACMYIFYRAEDI
jgi:hypothetical protein